MNGARCSERNTNSTVNTSAVMIIKIRQSQEGGGAYRSPTLCEAQTDDSQTMEELQTNQQQSQQASNDLQRIDRWIRNVHH